MGWTGRLVAASLGAAAIAALAACGGSSGERTPTPTPPSNGGIGPTSTPSALLECDPDQITLSLDVEESEAGSITVQVEGTAPVRCRLNHYLLARLRNVDGELSPVQGVGIGHRVTHELPGPLGSFVWQNECRFEGPFRATVTLGTAVARALIATAPSCAGQGIAATLEYVGPSGELDPGATATAIATQLEPCNLDGLVLRGELDIVDVAYVAIEVFAEGSLPCRLAATIAASIVGPGGEPLDVAGSGVTARVDVLLPAPDPIAAFNWQNRCGAGESAFRLTLDGSLHFDVPVEPAECANDAPNRLSRGGLHPDNENRTPVPAPTVLPVGLVPFLRQGAEDAVQRVATYGTLPPYETCDDLHRNLVPAERRGDVTEAVVECELSGAGRLRFLQHERTAVLYLHRIEILLLALVGLPDGGGECSDLANWMIPAEQDPDVVAEWITICDARPTLAGEESPDGRLVWVNVLEGSGLQDVPPDTPCWQLGAHLGARGEGRSEPVVCTFVP